MTLNNPDGPICKFQDAQIKQIFQDFLKEYSVAGNLCACNTITYENDNNPDYSISIAQKYYLLKYLYAYLAEYYLLYKKMLGTGMLRGNLNVLSIGCGCGIDLWGLYFAIGATGNKNLIKIAYTGIDLVDWQYKNKFDLKEVRYFIKEIKYFKDFKKNDFNVIVFPKSLGEMTQKSFDSICETFESATFIRNQIICICCVMDKANEKDMGRLRKIASIFQNTHKFQFSESLEKPQLFSSHVGIKNNLIINYEYPNEVILGIARLFKDCSNFAKNKKKPCKQDCLTTKHSPILKAKYMYYKTIQFQRQS